MIALVSRIIRPALIALAFMANDLGRAQFVSLSSSDLIRYLTYQSEDRRGKPITFTCGIERQERIAAVALAKHGHSAIPEIERYLHDMEARERPEALVGSYWLLAVYARIKGRDAFPRLQQLSLKSTDNYFQHGIHAAIELSLGMTSYVSASTPLGETSDCTRNGEPRHALNQFILAWLRNDRPWLEKSLGPTAKHALNSLSKNSSWSVLRRKLWRSPDDSHSAVGYRFALKNRWAEPSETLEETSSAIPVETSLERIDIQTEFTDRYGSPCGLHVVRFSTSPVPGLAYTIDNADIERLLALIASCASRSR